MQFSSDSTFLFLTTDVESNETWKIQAARIF